MEKNKAPQRGLQNRHIQLIAIAGTIGTGLFLGAGKTISMTGPSILFAYLVIGVAMFIFLRTIGEMLYQDPTQHSFLNFVTKYSGPRFCLHLRTDCNWHLYSVLVATRSSLAH